MRSSAPPTAAWSRCASPQRYAALVGRIVVLSAVGRIPGALDRLAQRAAADRARRDRARRRRRADWSSRARWRWRPTAAPWNSTMRFGGAPVRDADRFRFPIEEYLFARGDDYVQNYRAETVPRLCESIDLHRMDATQVRTPATLIAVREDQLVPFADMQALARRLNGPRQLIEINSIFGHDAFLKEAAALHADHRTGRCGADHEQTKHTSKTLATRSVRAGLESDTQHGAVVPPIHLIDELRLRRLPSAAQSTTTRAPAIRRATSSPAALADLEGGAGAVVTVYRHGRDHLVLATLPHGRARRRAARLLRRHLPAVRRAARAGQICRCDFVDQSDAAALQRGARGDGRTGLDRDAEQSAAAHRRHRAPIARRRTRPARWSSSTTPSCRRSGSSRWRSAPTSSCIRRPST